MIARPKGNPMTPGMRSWTERRVQTLQHDLIEVRSHLVNYQRMSDADQAASYRRQSKEIIDEIKLLVRRLEADNEARQIICRYCESPRIESIGTNRLKCRGCGMTGIHHHHSPRRFGMAN